MERQHIFSERLGKNIFRVMIIAVVLFMVSVVIVLLFASNKNKNQKIAHLELNGEVEKVYQKDPHNVTWYVAVLKGSDKEIKLERTMINNIQPGDSLFKKAGEDFYQIKNQRSGLIIKYYVTQ